MKLAMLILAVGSLPLAHAEDAPVQPLFQMVNDRDTNVDLYGIVLQADGSPSTLVTAPGGQASQGSQFPFAQIAQQDGVVLVELQGRKAMLLQGALEPGGQSGQFHLQFLANGLTGRYTTCDFNLARDEKGYFARNAYTGERMSQIRLVSWALGIKTLEGLCP